MAALSRLGIGCDEPLDVRAHYVAPWVAPLVAPPVVPALVGHWCSVPPALRENQVASPSPLDLVAVLRWQGFSPLELVASSLEVDGHPTCPSL